MPFDSTVLTWEDKLDRAELVTYLFNKRVPIAAIVPSMGDYIVITIDIATAAEGYPFATSCYPTISRLAKRHAEETLFGEVLTDLKEEE